MTGDGALQMSIAEKNINITLAGFGITFLGAILFSTKAIIVKVAFAEESVDALTLLTLRMVFSLPFYIGAALLAGRQTDTASLTKRQWLYVLILGLFGYYFSSLFDFVGLQYISAGLERLILFLYPTFAVLINAFVFKQPIRRVQKIALFLTYAGIGLAYYGELRIDTLNPNFFHGSILIFLCAITYSIYIAGSGNIIPKVGASRFTAYAMLAATGGVFIHFILAGNYTALRESTGLWGYGLMLAIFATVIPSFLISFGMKRIGSNNVAIISGIGPVSTILQAHFVLGEKIFMEQIAGTALVIIGVLLIGWRQEKSIK
jgi:drug/metabolite transporter (DMT)-like permease